jgi:hypothetical protein
MSRYEIPVLSVAVNEMVTLPRFQLEDNAVAPLIVVRGAIGSATMTLTD